MPWELKRCGAPLLRIAALMAARLRLLAGTPPVLHEPAVGHAQVQLHHLARQFVIPGTHGYRQVSVVVHVLHQLFGCVDVDGERALDGRHVDHGRQHSLRARRARGLDQRAVKIPVADCTSPMPSGSAAIPASMRWLLASSSSASPSPSRVAARDEATAPAACAVRRSPPHPSHSIPTRGCPSQPHRSPGHVPLGGAVHCAPACGPTAAGRHRDDRAILKHRLAGDLEKNRSRFKTLELEYL